MSRPELLAPLREATPAAPAELRAQVRELGRGRGPAAAPPPRLARSALAAAALAVALAAPSRSRPCSSSGQLRSPRAAGGARRRRPLPEPRSTPAPAARRPRRPRRRRAASSPRRCALPRAERAPARSATRRRSTAAPRRRRARSRPAARRAVRIAQALGGYPQSRQRLGQRADAARRRSSCASRELGSTTAVDRLSALGTVVGEQVSISDLQAGVDTTGLRIVRLERELAAAIHAPQTAAEPAARRRADGADRRAAARARGDAARAPRDATVSLAPRDPAPQARSPRRAAPATTAPSTSSAVVFRHAGIVAVYVLALGAPLAALASLVWFARLAPAPPARSAAALLSRS